MREYSTTIITISALVISAGKAHAEPPPCMRWQNQLTVCEALDTGPGANCTTDPAALEGTPDVETFNSLKYASSAKGACRQLLSKMDDPYMYTPGAKLKACTFGPGSNECIEPFNSPFFPPGDGEMRWCVYDVTGPKRIPDGVIDWDDASVIGLMVSYSSARPDSHCFCTADKGPYKDLAYDHEAETNWALSIAWLTHAFPAGLKKAVLEANYDETEMTYKSDAKLDDETYFDTPNLQKDEIHADDAAEIDHIIPRKDSKGCRCGDPTPNNAAVISRKLNQSMSNTSPLFDENRAKMFEQYVTCPSSVDVRFTGQSVERTCDADLGEASQIDESTMGLEFEVPKKAFARPAPMEETGGCSAGGLAGVGVALSLLGLRRRRARAVTSPRT